MPEEPVVTPVTPVVEPTPPVVAPVVETPAPGPVATPTETPLVVEEKLYAGKYKTVEEMESGYLNSNSEATKMAQEINRLKQMVQSSLTPGEEQEVKDKIIKLENHFDGETSKVLTQYFNQLMQSKLAENAQTTQTETAFATQVSDSWQETLKLYPEAADPKGKLYIRANEIMFERGLAEVDPTDGKVVLLTPFAYRMAVEAASLELGKQTPVNPNKPRVGAIAGRAGAPAAQGKLSYEQYMALPSDEDRDAYDNAQRA